MQQLHYNVQFLTPAFLGNAYQAGQWRTPPFKALLRQWWRVVWSAGNGYPSDVLAMREAEGLLFGNAWLDGKFSKSRVRIRLDKWSQGKVKQGKWGDQDSGNAAKVLHPEVRQPIGPLLYLGYGLLNSGRRSGTTTVRGQYGTRQTHRTAIQYDERAELKIAAPTPDAEDIRRALFLADLYGTVGGRSRNGWGSLSLKPIQGTRLQQNVADAYSRPWEEALGHDWPHAIGRDDHGPLVWRSATSYNDWRLLMRDLAIVKIGFRTMFQFQRAPGPEDRHWLSYPITKHKVREWHSVRLPNSLRFKVRPDPENAGKLRAFIFHMPCLPPPGLNPDRSAIKRVWNSVHDYLDVLCQESRDYPMIPEGPREKMRKQLDTVRIERYPR